MMKPEDQSKVDGGFVRIFVAMVLAVLIFGGAGLGEDLVVSEAKDISQLGLEAVQGQKPLTLSGVYTTSLTYGINVADCSLIQTADGYDDLIVKDLRCLSNPGQPKLPVKTLVSKLSKDAKVLGIEVVGGSYREIVKPVNLAPTPAPRVWMREEDIRGGIRERLKATSFDAAAYSLDVYLPGRIAGYSTGEDNNSSFVYVRVFPVQYIPMSKKAILVTNVTINIYYSLPAVQKETLTILAADPAECVIICPASLTSAAELLKDFHINEESVSTSVVTTEGIDATYPAAPDPPYSGYKDDYPGKDRIVGYNYELARKIVSYLRDQAAHPNLKYVTLLGDGGLVPPSYYINEWGSDWYEDWIPTDFLYTSPDYDYVPNYCVGRLPVSDATQAASIISKMQSWHSNLSWDWFKRASVGGGRPFGSMWYYGELNTGDLINEDAFNGMDVAKYYYTDGTFDVAHVAPLLSTEDTGLFYHVSHGSGVEMFFEYDYIGASQVMGYSPNTEVPVVVSVACINGAYDTDLTNFDWQPTYPSVPYPTSFGESIVLSEAGGIAYVGGSRLNYAGWYIWYDQGRVVADHYYMCDILGLVIESYHTGVNRLGDMTYDALGYYAQNNDMDSWVHKTTLFGFVLLGDPVLSVPAQQPGPSYQKPYLEALDPNGYTDEGIPHYKDLPLDESVSIVSNSDSPTVDAKSIYTWDWTILDKLSPAAPPVTYTFTPPGCGYYLIRSSGEDGKEGWLYLNAQHEFIVSSEILLIDKDYGADYERYYTGALDELGEPYDIWEVGPRDPIDAETLAEYLDGIVIWAIAYDAPIGPEIEACQLYLDSGGKLFISGQDIGYYLAWGGPEANYFYEHYLYAEFVQDDGGTRTLSGVAGDPIGDGLTITIEGGDGADNQWWPDEIEPISPAAPVFLYEPGREAALAVETGIFSVVYFAFGFEGINSQADRNEVMGRVLDWLRPGLIQQAINEASEGDEIVINEGVYYEHIDFKGKNVTLRSTDPEDPAVVAATVISGRGRGTVVTFSSGEQKSCVLAGFTITDGNEGICITGAGPTITNCRIVGNRDTGIDSMYVPGVRYSAEIINCAIVDNGGDGIRAEGRKTPTLTNCIISGNRKCGVYAQNSTITNCNIVGNAISGILGYDLKVANSIIWDNSQQQIIDDYSSCSVTYSNVQGGWPGEGNINANPCFVELGSWIPDESFGPNPADGQTYMDPNVVLSWSPGRNAVSHDVYFGTEFDDVNNATTDSAEYMGNEDSNSWDSNNYDPNGLEPGTTYYWRVDGVNDLHIGSPWKGAVWSFTTLMWEPNLVGWWQFDEGQGDTAADSSSYGNDGAISDNVSWVGGVCDGNALEFSDGRVLIPDANELRPKTQLTVSAWVNYVWPQDDFARILAKGANDYETFSMEVDGDGLVFYVRDNVYYQYRRSYGPHLIDHNEWVHVAGTYDGSEVRCYLNGESGYSNYAGPIILSQDTVGLGIGNAPDVPRPFDGTIDEVRLYDRGLSSEEIEQLYRSCSSGDDELIIEYGGDYHLLSGSACIDAGSNVAVPADTYDLDGDGNTTEPIPWDLDGNPRIVDGDNGGNCVVDMGAYEYFVPAIEVEMRFTPRALNPESKGRWVKAHFVLPEGYAVGDVDANRPAIIEPGGIESEYMNVFVNEDGLVAIEAAFSRGEFCGIVTGDEGIEVTVVGRLTSGQQFYGTDIVKITSNALKYLASLASYWLEAGCGKPDWCGGVDVDQDSVVNFVDFALFDGCCVEIISE